MTVVAEIIAIMGKLGIKGVSRVRCRILDGRDRGRVVTRNVVGPVRMGDILLLKDTSMESEGRFAGGKNA